MVGLFEHEHVNGACDDDDADHDHDDEEKEDIEVCCILLCLYRIMLVGLEKFFRILFFNCILQFMEIV